MPVDASDIVDKIDVVSDQQVVQPQWALTEVATRNVHQHVTALNLGSVLGIKGDSPVSDPTDDLVRYCIAQGHGSSRSLGHGDSFHVGM
jgi:hypothetical protein